MAMKLSEAWATAQRLADTTRQHTKIVKLPEDLGGDYAFTIEGFPLKGEVVGVAMVTKKKRGENDEAVE